MLAAMHLLMIVSAVGCALIAGVFYAFSTFVMRALARRPTAEGIAVMQSINVVVLNPLFLGPFLGLTLLSAGAAVAAEIAGSPASGLTAVGAGLYAIGTVGVTILRNVPLNNRLAAADPLEPASAELWAMYLRRWTFWNHVRAAAGLAASVMFVVAVGRP